MKQQERPATPATEATRSAFWDFSVAVYAHSEVRAVCLELQDRQALDVNVLLFALYAGWRGRRLATRDFDDIERHVQAWRENIVHALRRARRWLEEQSDPSGSIAQLRQGVLAREIEAEAHQQRIMEALVFMARGWPDANAAADNLLRYLTRSRVLADKAPTAQLATLVSAVFPGTDQASCFAAIADRFMQV
jgi:uncharacterized protein (TIGR02444 family)